MKKSFTPVLSAVLLAGVMTTPALAHIGHDVPPPPPPSGEIPPPPLTCPPTAFCNAEKTINVNLDRREQITPAFTLANVHVYLTDTKNKALEQEEVVFNLIDVATSATVFSVERATNTIGHANLYDGGKGVDFVLEEGKQYRWLIHTHVGNVQVDPFVATRPKAQDEPDVTPLPPTCGTTHICNLDGSLIAAPDPRGLLTETWRLGNLGVQVRNESGKPAKATQVTFALVNVVTDETLHEIVRTTDDEGHADLYAGGANIDYVPADGLTLRWVITTDDARISTLSFARPAATAATLAPVPAGTWPSAATNPVAKAAAEPMTYAKPTKVIRVTEGAWEHKHDSLAETINSLKGKVGPKDLIEIQLKGTLHHLPKSIDLDGATLRIVGETTEDGRSELVRYTPDPNEHEVATVVVHSPVQLVNVRISPQNSPGAALAFRASAHLDNVVVASRALTFADDKSPAFGWSRRISQAVDRAKNPVLTVRDGKDASPVRVTIARSTFEHVAGVHVDGAQASAVVHSSTFTGVPFTAAGLSVSAASTTPSAFVHNRVDLAQGGHAVALAAPGTVTADLTVTGKDQLISEATAATIKAAAETGNFVRAFAAVKHLLPRLTQPTAVVAVPPGADPAAFTVLGTNPNGGVPIAAVGDGVPTVPPAHSQPNQPTPNQPTPNQPGPSNPGSNTPGANTPGANTPGAGQPVPGGPAPQPGVTPSPSPSPATYTTTRLAGANRIETAIAVNAARKLTAPKQVFIASANTPADAVAAAPLAAVANAPLYVTWHDKVDTRLASALANVITPETEVVFLGGEQAISTPVANELAAKAKGQRRLAGANRAATATVIADELRKLRPNATAIVADGQGWEAPIVVAPAAIKTSQVVLLSNGDQAAPETVVWLKANPAATVTNTVGKATTAHPAQPNATTPKALTGANAAELSLAVAQAFFPKPNRVGVATALGPTDAMVAGPYLADAPILLIDGTLTKTQQAWMQAQAIQDVVIFGGPKAVPDL